MFKTLSILTILGVLAYWVYSINIPAQPLLSPKPSPKPVWSVRSIDTMKYSRDLAREKGSDASYDTVIDMQVANIASTGATHIAIATPYDQEFVPFMTRWVQSARAHDLKVWYRGNLSGWEKWFQYPRISRAEHIAGVESFIKNNPTLFENGDIFTPCPECENGVEGDPRQKGDVAGYRQFLKDEYRVSSEAFRGIGKNVSVGYFSMNYDVAKLVMDKETTQALGGVVAIDHYVKSPEKMISDITAIKESSGGKVFLGEFGAPIPDIHGKMSEDEQGDWIRRTLDLLRINKSVIGINYWVGTGGSTQLWDNDGNPRFAVTVLTSFYKMLE